MTRGASPVSWGAIIAGTAVAAATSLLLFALATGVDLASMSSWPRRGISVASLTALAAVTLILTQWISAGLGGYITGRLRTSWVGTHTHEVFFRDTAHGLITWAMATVLLASGVFSPAASSPTAALRKGALAVLGAPPACGAPTACPTQSAMPPRMVLPNAAALSSAGPSPRELLVQAAPAGGEPAGTRALVRVTPASTESPAGNELSLPANASFVDAQLASAADAREAATGSVLTALSMLIGAFIACVCAALGGRLRDLHA